MLSAIVLLEGDPPSQSQISGRLKPVSLKNFPVFNAILSILTSFPVPADDDVLRVMRGVRFAPDIVFFLMAKKLSFSLI